MKDELDGWKIFPAEYDCGMDGQYYFLNIVPMYGRDHSLHPDCWCEPDFENPFLIHHMEH